MARPRVFVSSTFYDLKHVRSSLDLFIESLGYDSILSEKGDIAYAHDTPLDESCYREAEAADMFVLIVGGRYGSETSKENKRNSRSFFKRYESITKNEYESAVRRDIPVYILVESGVYSEYHTFLRNKSNESINYAHVDSANIFHLIEEILGRPRNNPVHTFERFSDIESWLREQWSGLFRELLQNKSQQRQFAALAAQVSELREINETLKKYLEAMMRGVGPDVSSKLIASEEERLREIRQYEDLREIGLASHLNLVYGVSFEDIANSLKEAVSVEEFVRSIGDKSPVNKASQTIMEMLMEYIELARRDLNDCRSKVGLDPLRWEAENESKQARQAVARTRRTPVKS